MGFRRPLAFFATITATASIAVALSVMAATPTAPPAPAASTAPASSASAAIPTDPVKAAQKKFAALQAVKTKPGDAKAGQGKAAACAACHGMDGNSSDPQYPKLAGQSEQYIVTELMRFQSGVRTNAIMAGMSAALTPQDMHDIGAYFAEQKPLPGVADEATVEAGRKLFREGDAAKGIPACMACHGPAGRGNPGARYPHLAGQHADYVQKMLQAWHDGESWGSDPHAQIMPAIAKRLSEADIAAVASYIEGLHIAEPPGSAAATPAAPASTSAPASTAASNGAPASNTTAQ